MSRISPFASFASLASLRTEPHARSLYAVRMDDPNQIEVPPSFLLLYASPSGQRLTQSMAEVRDRYELCEDLAQMLVEHPTMQQGDDAASQAQLLGKTRLALEGDASPVRVPEAGWVIQRLAELLGWEAPALPAAD